MKSEPAPDQDLAPSVRVRGIAGSPGVAIGPAVVVGPTFKFKRRHVPDRDVDYEVFRLQRAIDEAVDYLKKTKERAGRVGAQLAILDAYVLMIGDPVLLEETERKIRVDRKCAEWAVSTVTRELATEFENADDLYLRERAQDFRFVGQLVVRALSDGFQSHSFVKFPRPAVVVAHDLSPADTAAMAREPVIAIVTEKGTRTSHTAIMARALKIPAVVGLSDLLSRVGDGEELVVDGRRGEVILRPSDDDLAASRIREERHHSISRRLSDGKDRAPTTACGVPIGLRANIELVGEAVAALSRGAQGIGLYRTEFMYVDRAVPPTEDEQHDLYCSLLDAVSPHPVVARTFDIGGDKFASSFAMPSELNPALGLRAVRLGLARPELLLDQLRAMVRASACGPMRILIPLVATLTELRQVRQLLDQAIADVDRRGLGRAEHIPLGVMMEVPSAVLMAERFARESDFMSLGTNDLIQYTLAADRTNRSLAYLASPFEPAILRLVNNVVDACEIHHTPLSLCGEMASDPLASILLVGLGLRELSMDAGAVPEIKETLHRVTLKEAQDAAQQALLLDTAEEVEQALAKDFAPRLVDLLDTP